MLDLSVDVHSAQFCHDYFIKCTHLLREFGVDCGRGLRAKRVEERTGDAQTFKHHLRIFMLDRLLEEICDFSG